MLITTYRTLPVVPCCTGARVSFQKCIYSALIACVCVLLAQRVANLVCVHVQLKRTNVGISLVSNPRVLFLDEPTSGTTSVLVVILTWSNVILPFLLLLCPGRNEHLQCCFGFPGAARGLRRLLNKTAPWFF